MPAFAGFDEVLSRLLGYELGQDRLESIRSGGSGSWLRLVELHDDPAEGATPPPQVPGQLRFWAADGTRMRWVAVEVTHGGALGRGQGVWSALPGALPPLISSAPQAAIDPELLRSLIGVERAATNWLGLQQDQVNAEELALRQDPGFVGRAAEAYGGGMRDVESRLAGVREGFAAVEPGFVGASRAADALDAQLDATASTLAGPWGTPADGLSRILASIRVEWSGAGQQGVSADSVTGVELPPTSSLVISSPEWGGAGPFDVFDPNTWGTVDQLTREAWARHVDELVQPFVDSANAYDDAVRVAAGMPTADQEAAARQAPPTGNDAEGPAGGDVPPGSEGGPGVDGPAVSEVGTVGSDGGVDGSSEPPVVTTNLLLGGGSPGVSGVPVNSGASVNSGVSGFSDSGGFGGSEGFGGSDASRVSGDSAFTGVAPAVGQPGWSVAALQGGPVADGPVTPSAGSSSWLTELATGDAGPGVVGRPDSAFGGTFGGEPATPDGPAVPVLLGATGLGVGGSSAERIRQASDLGDLTGEEIQLLLAGGTLPDRSLTAEELRSLAAAGVPTGDLETLADLDASQWDLLAAAGALDDLALTDAQRAALAGATREDDVAAVALGGLPPVGTWATSSVLDATGSLPTPAPTLGDVDVPADLQLARSEGGASGGVLSGGGVVDLARREDDVAMVPLAGFSGTAGALSSVPGTWDADLALGSLPSTSGSASGSSDAAGPPPMMPMMPMGAARRDDRGERVRDGEPEDPEGWRTAEGEAVAVVGRRVPPARVPVQAAPADEPSEAREDQQVAVGRTNERSAR